MIRKHPPIIQIPSHLGRRLALVFVLCGFLAGFGAQTVSAADLSLDSPTTNRYKAINNAYYTGQKNCDPTTSGTTTTAAPTTPSTPGGTPTATATADGQMVQTGVTTYGGEFKDGIWWINNINQAYLIRTGKLTAEQLGGKLTDTLANMSMSELTGYYTSHTWPSSVDDNGFGNADQPGGLNGKAAFARLRGGIYSNTPNDTKVEVNYNGNTAVTVLMDEGSSNTAGGMTASMDLWWETAKLLNFTQGSGIVMSKIVDKNTPTTPVGTGTTAAAGTTGTAGAIDPACCPDTSGDAAAGAGVSGSTNFERIANYFGSKGFKSYAIAGILANLQEESHLSAFAVQNQTTTPSQGTTPPSGSGYGIAQFTPATKISDELQKNAATSQLYTQYYSTLYGNYLSVGAWNSGGTGVPAGVPEAVNNAWLSTQLDYFYNGEMANTTVGAYRDSEGGMGLDYISNTDTLAQAFMKVQNEKDAAKLFLWIYERPNDKPSKATARGDIATAMLLNPAVQKYGTTSSSVVTTPSTSGLTTTTTTTPTTVAGKGLAALAQMFGSAYTRRADKDFGDDRVTVGQYFGANAAEVVYPAHSSSGASGGAQLLMNYASGSVEEATLSYRVYFPTGFNFVIGGKLPGLYGGTTFDGATGNQGDGFSTRYMWRVNGGGELYLYAAAQPPGTADSPVQDNSDKGYSVSRDKFTFATGKWIQLTQHVKLNTPGQPNGTLQVSVDGQSVINRSDIQYRNSASVKIEGVFFSTFFGGTGSQWETPTEQKAYFADFSQDGTTTTATTLNCSVAAAASTTNGSAQSLINLIQTYAWVTGTDSQAGSGEQKPAYAEAVTAAKAKGWHVGGNGENGNDCAGFINIAMRTSGYEANWPNSLTETLAADIAKLPGWKQVNHTTSIDSSTTDLQPGDVLVTQGSGHALIYIGTVSWTSSRFVEAALHTSDPGRAPYTNITPSSNYAGGYLVFRKGA